MVSVSSYIPKGSDCAAVNAEWPGTKEPWK